MSCLPGTLDIFFDNIGKYVIKNYRISTTKVKSADIITTSIQILNKDANKIQLNKELKPKRSTPLTDIPPLHEKMELEIQKSAENFRKYRFQFLTHIFKNSRNDNHQIDTLVESLKISVHRRCSNQSCAVTYENLKRKCDACGSRVEKIDQNVIKSNILSTHNFTDTSQSTIVKSLL